VGQGIQSLSFWREQPDFCGQHSYPEDRYIVLKLVLKKVNPRNRQRSKQGAGYHTGISECSSGCVIVEWGKSHIPALSVMTAVTEEFWWATVILLTGGGRGADCDQIFSSRN